jgi:hypothetical protein
MLDKKTRDAILDFIRIKPRTVQEVAQHIDRNWRTAERYVDTISTETGFIATRTFREGTRGALKIAYWSAISGNTGSAYQERLLQHIQQAKRKEEFSPFDIYQLVPEAERAAHVERSEFSTHPDIMFDSLLLKAHRQVLFFSGNLSWMELGPNMEGVLDQLAKRGVTMKVLTRVDITSEANTTAFLALNERFGRDVVQIRHCEQPLRAMIIDDSFASIKEVLSPATFRELKEKQFIFYIIRNAEWIAWLQKVFWHLWQQSIDAQARLDALQTLKKS